MANGSDFNNSVSTTEQATHETVEFKVVKIIFYCIILTCSTVGNGLVIYVIKTTERMRTPSNILVLNLAVCDLVTPLISIPFDFALEENGYVWMYGGFMCKILWPGATLSTTSSSLTLAAISFDRYRVIMHPFKSKLSMDKVKIIISFIHMFSIFVITPYIYVLHLQGKLCTEAWPGHEYRQAYTLVLFLVQYCIPLIFMTIMYTLTLKSLFSASVKTWVMRKDRVEEQPITSTQESEVSVDNNNFHAQPKRKKWRLLPINPQGASEANKRATKMFIVIVIVFASCMFPNQVVWFWSDFGDGMAHERFKIVSIICWIFTYANSVCNSVIYAMFSNDFRKGFYHAYGKFCCKVTGHYEVNSKYPDNPCNRLEHLQDDRTKAPK